MSRIGRKAVDIVKGSSVEVKGTDIIVKGPKGELHAKLMPGIVVDVNENQVNVSRTNEEKQTRAWHGMTRALIANMVTGVTTGFSKTMEIVGVGWRAALQGKKLVMNLGYSHPIEFMPPEGIEIVVENPIKFHVKGIDKELVGQTCALIKKFRPPEPYHGKGIKFENEYIIRKAGKTGAK
ncbi:MAG: 50S ribosomal protein L6 [Synergistaceae bacterium]|nr:50S ribosomal protein L6 [Synergistaceae bacterium]MBQ6737860.1 50S ribosomal protein L6 [Synergistaceae bacterium]MBQ7068605.1 50S ribosomal protein L6 [Synergistaceae bacterium]MBR0076423.1 50S ribosomal protein L6 [Synergistaceae bacterium]MBR0080785.1 50S ribosomal protein L6 [Synergistaceae bacterium]